MHIYTLKTVACHVIQEGLRAEGGLPPDCAWKNYFQPLFVTSKNNTFPLHNSLATSTPELHLFRISWEHSWLTHYLNYFLVALTKHHGQGNLQNKGFNWVYSSKGLESMTATQRDGSRSSWELIFCFTIRSKRNPHWMVQVFGNLKVHSPWLLLQQGHSF